MNGRDLVLFVHSTVLSLLLLFYFILFYFILFYFIFISFYNTLERSSFSKPIV